MSYMHIDNLYKNQDILQFKECYAMEKIHGTSAHISYKDGQINFYAGGSCHETFVALFNKEELHKKLNAMEFGEKSIHIYGESYGGKIQRMSATYGPDHRFVAFEVKIGEHWLNVPKAEKFCRDLGLDFVAYNKIPTTIEAIDAERDKDSEQAIRNGMGTGHMREGVVLRPLIEVIQNDGKRIIAKHKRDEFRETATPRKLIDKLVKIEETEKIITEWVTDERLAHVLDSSSIELRIENIGKIIPLMIEDIYREGKDEIVESKELERAIGRATALMLKRRLNGQIRIY